MAEQVAIYTWFRDVPEEAQGKKRKKDKRDPSAEESNDVQVERCRAYAEAMGYDIAAVYRETASKPTDDRPELMRLRSAIWSRKIDVVVATHPNRVYVDIDRLVRLASEARSLGIRFEFLEMPFVLPV